MERDFAATSKVDSPGRVEQRGQLGEAVALATWRDPRKLAAHLGGERHRLRIYNHVMIGPGLFRPPPPVNEPVRDYAPGSPERKALKRRLDEMQRERLDIPSIIGGEEVRTGDTF